LELNYNEVFQFMRDFGIDILNKYNELVIDNKWNIYTNIDTCQTIDDVKTHVIFSLCRPIGKGLDSKDAKRLLHKVNKYFKVNLTREDMRLMYAELCYRSKVEEFKEFINRGFPMEELKKVTTA
jgi:hypothetical protein